MLATKPELQQNSPFSPLDLHFAGLMQKFAEPRDESVFLAAALASYFRSRGHICVHLKSFCRFPFLPDSNDRISCPPLNLWIKSLQQSKVVGSPGDFRPLILDEQGRLYLHRYWTYENNLAELLKGRLTRMEVEETKMASSLHRLFPSRELPDWQKIAAFTAATRNLTIISGGPGTGKTSTVLKILALLLEQGKPLRIALTAPTGKAASRLQETIKTAKQKLACAEEVKANIPESAFTIHRLLGVRPDSPFFRHHARNPLPVDVVIIDEASMVDLALMAKLLDAIPATARVILLGDKDQLSSVEAGAVLGDICDATDPNSFSPSFLQDYSRITGDKLDLHPATKPSALTDCIVELQKNYRFGDDSTIYRASIAVRSGNFKRLEGLLAENSIDFRWIPQFRINEDFKKVVREGYEPFLTAETHTGALLNLNHFRILAAVRDSEYGVTEINRRVERILRDEGLITPHHAWYAGRPIMVIRNDYTLNLFNGDTGIIRRGEASGDNRAFFLTAENEVRSLLPVRLPEFETVFAMTIHKSQGSEFDHVMVILPEKNLPILTQELLYTGITRARKRVTLVASEQSLELALSRRVERSSGLQARLCR